MTDCLAIFEDTRSVMQAEQVLIRRGIPFETVPRKKYSKSGCGLAIQFDESYKDDVHKATEEAQLNSKIIPI
ncbi:hypothetical protein CEE37_12940 [candidate division LCP-89 bacterium B3_LCP]|uniref:Putative Se/S carrier protein-like domain-containing protein n=1 Tax=candidate division LCP-89 bacterium B3_LCP TaxID=2012998 RepID=A0A532UTZ8_UNCL8|nr:MAG: hypothetical protein CEE37_12940 [candidate division LCP-89 bacterium B3_LCP]